MITRDLKAEMNLRTPKVDIGRHWAGQVNMTFELSL